MGDYGDLNRIQINRLIAERLGWRVELSTDDGETVFSVIDPLGCKVAPLLSATGLENFWYGRYAPRYADRLDNAWLLFGELPHDVTPRLVRFFEPRGDHMAAMYKAAILNNGSLEQIEAIDDEPARAVCLAWLAWDDAQKAKAQP